MKKRYPVILGLVVTTLVFVAFNASAHKYLRKTSTPTQDVIAAESVTSMSDCMNFSASFGSRGRANDQASFKREFGAPISRSGRTTTYNYDNYTRILLDCSGNSCNCRCLSK